MYNTLSVYDGLKESSASSRWCTIQDVCRYTNETPRRVKHKLMDLCKRGLAERKINLEGKPINLFRSMNTIDNSSAKIKIDLPLNIKHDIPAPSSPGTWNFGYDKKTEQFLSAKPGNKIIRGEK